MRVTVAYSPGPRELLEWTLDLPEGSTLAQALAQSGLDAAAPRWREQALSLAVWGRAAPAAQVLREADRVEVLRALRVDPKVARRERFARQGSRGTGLFAKKPSKNN